MKTRQEKSASTAVPEFLAYSKPILLYKRHWHRMTSPLGWPWLGVYSTGSEAVGLNAVDRFILDRSSKRALGVSADASGLVKLFPYPVQLAQGQPPARDYTSHASGVSKVRFSASGKFVVSLGSRDCCIIQWEVLAPAVDQDVDAEAGPGEEEQSDDDDDELDRLSRARE